MSNIDYIPKLRGGKGGDAPKPTPPPVEDPNTLQSRATGRILYCLGEGPFKGIVGGYAEGAKNIYLNDTPLMNSDGSLNFQGVSWDYRVGTPDQSWIEGFPAVENTHSSDVGLPVEIKRSTPAIRTITNTNANAVRIIVSTPGMVDQDVKTGNARGTRIDFVIRIRRQGRSGWEAQYPLAIIGKTVSTYEEQYRLGLMGEGPWDVMVERLTPDSDRASLSNGLSWSSYVEIIDRKMRYPNSALLALTFDGKLFGSSMPTVTSRWDTWIIRVPNNYDPISGLYTGIWNGGWKMAFSSNPAYLFMALLTHRAGCDLPDSAVDAGAIYSCGRYCDELVPSGTRNNDGSMIMERRFEAHFVHNTKQEAYAVINALASTFRAMAYWAAGAVTVVADAPRDPLFAVNASQTIGGFELSGPAVRAIKTVAMISYLDPDDLDKPNMEIYEDIDLIKKYGWQPESLTAFACKSKGQARRLGKWFIETGKLGDALSYKASIDHLHAQPGDVIVMTERSITGADLGGRIVTGGLTGITLDRAVTLEKGKGYRLHVTLPNGTVAVRDINTPTGSTTRTLSYTAALPMAPYPEASWVLEVSDLRPRQFRVMGVSDDGDLEYTIAAVPYDPTIYARVEQGLNIKLPPVARLPNPGISSPPSNVRVDRQYVNTSGGFTTALELSWDPSPDAYIKNYTVRYRRNNGNFETITDVSGATKTIYGESHGQFTFHVQAVNIAGVESRPAVLDIFISDSSPITLIRPSGLELEGQGNNPIFTGRDPVFVWRETSVSGSYDIGAEPKVGAGYLDGIFRDYEIRVYKNNLLVFTDHTPIARYQFTFDVNSATSGGPHRAFKFEVVMRDRWGNYSLPAAIEVANPAPERVTGLEVIGGYGSVFVKFDKPKDLDFAGAIVWMSELGGVPAGPDTVAYDGPNNFIVLQVPPNVDRFVQVAAYDSFGKEDLNLSGEIKVRSVGVEPVDLNPPAVPIGLALADRVVTAADGTVSFMLDATWTANAEDDFSEYAVEIAEEDGNFLHYQTNVPRYTWTVQAGVRYRVRLSAYDSGSNNSTYSEEVSHTVAGDDKAPAAPTELTLTATFKSVWLKWPQHPEPDFSHMEVHEASVNNRSQAVFVATAPGTTFIREGLAGGDERWYWIRAVDRSRNKSEFFPASLSGGVYGKTKKVEEADYQELSITNAIIANGAIDDAKIANLDAKKILAGSIMSGEVIIAGTGQTLSAATQGSSDPAAVINRGTTQILPGKIILSGGTSLQSMLYGADQTKIDGGNIAAGTIAANKLIIGLRGIEVIGVVFTPIKEANFVQWTGGVINYPSTTPGYHAAEGIVAGGWNWSGQIDYLYWHIGLGAIGATNDPNVTANPDVVVLATYLGAEFLHVTYGRTIIDGNTIRTDTILADRIKAFSITAKQLSSEQLITAKAQIGTGVITDANIATGTILNAFITRLEADKIMSGGIGAKRLQVGGVFGEDKNTIVIEGMFGYHTLRYHDVNKTVRVEIGQNAPTPNINRDGLHVRDINGKTLFHANGLGVEVAGAGNLGNNSVSQIQFSNGGGAINWTPVGTGVGAGQSTLMAVHAVARMTLGTSSSIGGGGADGQTFYTPGAGAVRLLLDNNPVITVTTSTYGTAAIPLNFVQSWPGGTSHTIKVQGSQQGGFGPWSSWGDLSSSSIMCVEYRK